MPLPHYTPSIPIPTRLTHVDDPFPDADPASATSTSSFGLASGSAHHNHQQQQQDSYASPPSSPQLRSPTFPTTANMDDLLEMVDPNLLAQDLADPKLQKIICVAIDGSESSIQAFEWCLDNFVLPPKDDDSVADQLLVLLHCRHFYTASPGPGSTPTPPATPPPDPTPSTASPPATPTVSTSPTTASIPHPKRLEATLSPTFHHPTWSKHLRASMDKQATHASTALLATLADRAARRCPWILPRLRCLAVRGDPRDRIVEALEAFSAPPPVPHPTHLGEPHLPPAKLVLEAMTAENGAVATLQRHLHSLGRPSMAGSTLLRPPTRPDTAASDNATLVRGTTDALASLSIEEPPAQSQPPSRPRPGAIDGIWGDDDDVDEARPSSLDAKGPDAFLIPLAARAATEEPRVTEAEVDGWTAGAPRSVTVVMGSRGLSRIRRAMVGSVCDHVVRHAPAGCAVVLPKVGGARKG
ncbi:hypothetical protein HDU96_009672 [Phlyctochytrium bullatum]|nr:hypothetical protein HDU96_009672 [Phlyctochytrium bullatum]